jgi:hypothetical protein
MVVIIVNFLKLVFNVLMVNQKRALTDDEIKALREFLVLKHEFDEKLGKLQAKNCKEK